MIIDKNQKPTLVIGIKMSSDRENGANISGKHRDLDPEKNIDKNN